MPVMSHIRQSTENLDKGSAKLLVLGDSGVGKSSLIHLICHSTVLSSAQWTIGCSIDVKLHDDHFMEFWDIGGSRGHKIARSFLYQDYDGIILVFDATNNKSNLNLKEWLVEVTHRPNDRDLETFEHISAPIITIATKKDLLPHGGILEVKDIPSHNDQNFSVVNFNENPQTNYPFRRHQSTPAFSTMNPLSSHSPINSQSSTSINEPLSKNQVIYVNTQDVLSFSPESNGYRRLNAFFKEVIDRKNRRNYRRS